ncbi:MAG: DNA-directed RNA polymerase subunit beta [Planctomycetota bacterium]
MDHLGNRRLRTIGELASDEIRKGFLKLRRTVQERMSLKEPEELTPRTLVNSKTISSAIEYFFGRGELSQVVDQTNPLAQLTHERRLSALGPGGLNRKRAGFEVRDVHISHYGRICPIETPEGTNIGLISSLSLYASVDEYGFLVTPYRVVRRGRVTDKVRLLRADEEVELRIAPADINVKSNGEIIAEPVPVRYLGDFTTCEAHEVDVVDISTKQLVGVSAALIPFLEHNDANRALMGSNMQRQAVPLLVSEPAIVVTGIERAVAENSGMVVRAEEEGVVNYVDATRIVVGEKEYRLRKFVGLNERTCLNQRPVVRERDRVKKGDVIADGAATFHGELALGKNVLVAFMAWDGYNFEDAILISEALLHEDVYTSIHIEEFEVEVRETKLGKEEFTRDIPNVSEKALRNLDEDGGIRIGTKVGPGDILVGKVSPKSKSELSPEEKLLHAIFGKAGEDVKNESLEVPSGVEGIVIDVQKFSRLTHQPDAKRRKAERESKRIEEEYQEKITTAMREMIRSMEEAGQFRMRMKDSGLVVHTTGEAGKQELLELSEGLDFAKFDIPPEARRKALAIYETYEQIVEELQFEQDRQIGHLRRGDELPPGVLEMVKVYVATKRTLSVGDKMAGRHGNKGVIAKILPKEDMPFLADGTPVQIVVNPLGVPSRMNVGQILETHLGWAAKILGFQAISPVFDGAKENEIKEALVSAGLTPDGQAVLHDGRTGEAFDQKVTVGYFYMMKLHHLVDDKVHARATGPYSLITQQPLGGKARFGGQRFGEMEVWALEAYGAAYILQELLTVKSDDVEGRTKIYESMVKGENTLEAGTPVSFEVLTNEIRGLGLNMQLEKSAVGSLQE